jgi:hypothetical protein
MPGGSVTRLTGRRCARCRFLRLTRSPVPVLMPRGAAGVRDPKPRQPLPELRSLGLGYFVVTERTAALLKAPFVRSNAWPTPAGRSSSVAAAPPARTANHAAHGRSGDTPTSCARSTPEAPSHGPVGGSGPHFDSILSPPCRRAVTALAHRVSEDVPLLRGNGPPPTIGGPFLCARAGGRTPRPRAAAQDRSAEHCPALGRRPLRPCSSGTRSRSPSRLLIAELALRPGDLRVAHRRRPRLESRSAFRRMGRPQVVRRRSVGGRDSSINRA